MPFDNLRNILGQLLKSTPNYEARLKEMEVLEFWPHIVGDRVSKHCWAVRMLDGGILLVAAESSSWLHNMRFLEQQIVEKYEKEFKEKRVRGLRFKLQTHHPE